MKRILFVEDEPTLQKTVGTVLRDEGFEVLSAMDGRIGLDVAQKMKPDLILLDLILPRLDGFQVLAKLKKEEVTKDIPVIVLTNLEGIQDVERALSLGAMTYLVKAEYGLQEVVDKIKSLLK